MIRHPFVLVSNRLPIECVDGRWQTSPGGLVRALEDVRHPDAAWVGWPGGNVQDVPDATPEGMRLRPVHLTDDQIEGYYESISNRAIWPLYHDAIRPSTFDPDSWRHYCAANRAFAEAAASVAAPGAVVWVHDYHLQLVPAMLREIRPDLRIGFFLHIPFPPQELFMRMPWREQVLEGLMGADLIGFQRRVAAENFVALAQRLIGADVDSCGEVRSPDGRAVQVGAYPISIDGDRIGRIARDPSTQAAARRIRCKLGRPRRVLLGVDRLDYTKGIVERLDAFRRLLEEQSNGRTSDPDLVLVQVAVPSRERIDDYTQQRDHVERLVGAINGEHAGLGTPVVHYLHQRLPLDELVALYCAADVMVVTPLRDGMNLVAKEFVASRTSGDGVLVLSEFAGAIDELEGAVSVNPHDPAALVRALRQGVDMSPSEAHERMCRMRSVLASNGVREWAESYLHALAA